MNLVETLREHERAWNERPLLRRLYRGWFELVASRLARLEGPTVELGSGLGRFREVVPDAVATDVEATPWADEIIDAERLPSEDASVANLVLVDVFHHLPRPARFLDEAVRVLKRGGRVVLLEPYCSPLSTIAYTRFHHERTDLDAPAFEDDERVARGPLESNQARPTLVFFRCRDEFRRRWPLLELVEARRFSLLLYPLSGGYSRRPRAPVGLYGPLSALERILTPLAPLAAFRCLVVLERRGPPSDSAPSPRRR